MDKTPNAYVRQHQRNLNNERADTLTTNTVNPKALPKDGVTPPAPKSTLVMTSFILLLAAIFLVVAAALFSLPYLAALAIVDGLAAVTLAILSLRETV